MMEENIEKKDIDKSKEWLCEKCRNKNLIDQFRCPICNYFNYDVYSGNYQEQNKNQEKKKIKKAEIQPIILEDKYIDYNYKEDYEFNREEKHKFNKCWHCGRENIYYKVKCNYCRFPINDSKTVPIKKTQLTAYDILHGITFDKPKKIKKETKYKEIEIKYNPLKEEKKYKYLGNIWICKYCKKKNNESIKFCYFCFKNRL